VPLPRHWRVASFRECGGADQRPEKILITREHPHLDDLSDLDAGEVHNRLLELDAVGFASELQRDGNPVMLR
jgi:hypothetical protein